MTATFRPARHYRSVIALIILIASSLLSNCWFDDSINRAIQVIDNGIYQIDQNSTAWQSVLQQVADQLPKDIDQSIRVEAQNLVSNSIAQAGVEFRCDTDFLGNRAKQSLQRLKALILKQNPAPLAPGFCQVVPAVVNLNVSPEKWPTVALYGYDFNNVGKDGKKLSVLFVSKNGSITPFPEDRIIRTTHYQMTLNTGGLARQLYIGQIVKLVVSWDGSSDNQPEVGVISWQSQPRTIKSYPVGRTGPYMPPRVGNGDRDFDTSTHEPTSLTVSGEIRVTPQKIDSRICMSAREREPDHTEVKGCDVWNNAYSAPTGWKIVEVNPRVRFDHSTMVTTHGVISGYGSSGEVVKHFDAQVDRDGSEAGTWSSVIVDWQPLTITIEETIPAWLR